MSLPDSLCHILVVWENVFFVCSLFLQDACWMFEPAAPTWNLFLSSPCVLNYTDIYCIFLLWIKDENKTKPTHYMDSDSSRQQSWFITVTIRSLTKWIKTVHAHLPPPLVWMLIHSVCSYRQLFQILTPWLTFILYSYSICHFVSAMNSDF